MAEDNIITAERWYNEKMARLTDAPTYTIPIASGW
jgi:hypothetical protein